jgi:hypothetical protein
MNEQAIRTRIELLRARETDNGNIIRKLERRLRNLPTKQND